MTPTTTHKPGIAFSSTDGNGNRLDDCVVPLDTDPTDFVLDRDGYAIVVGSFVKLPGDHSWHPGKVVQVTGLTRARIGGYTPDMKGAWSPTSPLNMLNVSTGRTHTGASAIEVVRVDMTPEASVEFKLVALNAELADNAEAMSRLAARRAALLVEIKTLEAGRV